MEQQTELEVKESYQLRNGQQCLAVEEDNVLKYYLVDGNVKGEMSAFLFESLKQQKYK